METELKDKSIVIYDAETKTFKTITTDEFLGEIRAEIKTHKSEFEALQTQLNILQNAELIENFKVLKNPASFILMRIIPAGIAKIMPPTPPIR